VINMPCQGWRNVPALLLLCLAAAAPDNEALQRLRPTEGARAKRIAAETASTYTATQAAAWEAAPANQRIQAAARLRTSQQRVEDGACDVDNSAMELRLVENQVAERSDGLSAMLPLALHLPIYQSETLCSAPAPPDKAVEGWLATQGVSAEFGRQVEALREEQQKERTLATSVARRRAALNFERIWQDQAALLLDRPISRASQAQASTVDEAALAAQAACAFVEQAGDRRTAIAAMDAAERPVAQGAARTAQVAEAQRRQRVADAARSRQAVLSRPAGPGLSARTPRVGLVAGHIARGWAAPSDDGPATGLTYSVAPGASVDSPCGGRVAFAAPFRSYGRQMIIECGTGYDFVLAGMDRLDAGVGRKVRAGEPLGRMAKGRSGQGKISHRRLDTGAQKTPLLYVELRKNGQAIDPLPYLKRKP
jgi:septal ring factor EnvC (AmiA/AmiB activator)